MKTRSRVRSWIVVAFTAALVLIPAGSSVAAPTTSPSPPAKKTVAGAESPPPSSACLTLQKAMGEHPLTKEQIASESWAQEWLRYSEAWTFSRGEGVTVAVVDSGVDASQHQLKGHVVSGYDVTSGKTTKGGTTDCAGHGTAVSSIIVAQSKPGIGLLGVAPGATILPIRVTWGVNAKGKETSIPFQNFLRAMNAAVAQPNVRVINVSVTVPAAGLTAAQRGQMESVVQAARKKNMIIVAASGNLPENGGEAARHVENYPAALAAKYDNVVAVTGVVPVSSSEDGTVANIALDSAAVTDSWVTVAAPGDGMLCAMARSASVVPCRGTSYAAPYVSGLAALLMSRYPDITPAEVRRLIEMTSETPVTGQKGSDLGYGMINYSSAVTAELPEVSEIRLPEAEDPLPAAAQDRDLYRIAAYSAAVLALALALLLPISKAVFRRGQSRGWKPGQTPTD